MIMYITHAGIGDAATLTTPWRTRVGLRTTPRYLAFLTLDRFRWNDASLTPALAASVAHLARHVRASWTSPNPVGFVRIVGHTDSTGKEKHNVALGNRRAQAVKERLEKLLADDIVKGRVRVAIVVEASPGPGKPKAKNTTPAGRARNRRVEVFIAPPDPAQGAPSGSGGASWEDFRKRTEQILQEIERKAAERREQTKFNKPLPTKPAGKSVRQWVNDWLEDRGVPKTLRKQIDDKIFNKDSTALKSLLQAAGAGGSEIEMILQTLRAAAQVK